MAGYFSRNWTEFKGQFQNWLAGGAKDLHNAVVPAFPVYVHGVDQPGTPLNMPAEGKSFEESLQSQKPPAPAAEPSRERGMEL